MWPKRNRASVFLIQRLLYVLLKSIIRTSLRWCPPKVTPPRVVDKRITVPRLDGIRWIGQDDIERFELVIFNQTWLCQSIATHDFKLLNPVHKHVHPSDGRGDQVDFLPI